MKTISGKKVIFLWIKEKEKNNESVLFLFITNIEFLYDLYSFISLLLRFPPFFLLRGLVDLITNILTFSLAGFFNCRQGYVTGKWSVEQNGWQGVRWTEQWVVECWGWGLGWKDFWMSDMRAAMRKKKGEKHGRVKAPWHAVHCPDDPLTFSQQKDVPGSNSVHHVDSNCWATSVH